MYNGNIGLGHHTDLASLVGTQTANNIYQYITNKQLLLYYYEMDEQVAKTLLNIAKMKQNKNS